MRNTHHAKTTGGRRQRTEAEAEVILGRYRMSGLTQRVVALKVGMSVSSLQYWLRRSRSKTEDMPRKAGSSAAAPALSLLEVELAGRAPLEARDRGGYEIELRSGVCLRVPGGFADGEVQRLLSLLKEVR